MAVTFPPDQRPDSCPFCAPRLPFLRENMAAVAFFDQFPVAQGHALVAPRRHVMSLFDLPEHERDWVWRLVGEVRNLLQAQSDASAFTIGVNDGQAAGQTIPHAHVHVIPRCIGDVADPRGGVRWVLPGKAAYWNA